MEVAVACQDEGEEDAETQGANVGDILDAEGPASACEGEEGHKASLEEDMERGLALDTHERSWVGQDEERDKLSEANRLEEEDLPTVEGMVY